MILIRVLVLTALNYSIIFRARHMPGLNNSPADCLSRFQIAWFKELSPQADELQQQCPRFFCRRVVVNLESLLSSVLASGSGQSYRSAWTLFREFHEKFYKQKPSIYH